MKEYKFGNHRILKAFDHVMYKVTFRKKAAGPETFETNILARNIVTLIEMIDRFKVHGNNSIYILKIENMGVCSDVYVGDFFDYSKKELKGKENE